MTWLEPSRIKVAVLAVGLSVLASAPTKADFTFGEPVNLGPPINSADYEGVPCVSADGLELYFASSRGVAWDVWVSTRQTTDDAWEPPENLGFGNYAYDPSISADGLELYVELSEDLPSGACCASFAIGVAKRAAKGEPWGPVVELGLSLPNGYFPAGPGISADGLELYFCALRLGDEPDAELYVARRETTEATWGEPISLGPVVNDQACQVNPAITSDGLLLISTDWWNCSLRPGGFGSVDMWMTRRATKDDDWGPLVNVGLPINSAFEDRGGTISSDGPTIYFHSNRPGGSGWHDLWQAPILPVVDFDDDGSVGMNDLLLMIECWGTNEPLCDIGPMPWGDGVVDEADLEVLMNHWGEDDPVYIVVDDFESYNDNTNAGTTIFHTWLDGMGHGEITQPEPAPAYPGNGTGSVVGHASGPPFAEQTIVYGGYQSMPLWYDNDGAIFEGGEWEKSELPFYSEAQRTWEAPQDWTRKGVEVLTLWLHGDPANAPARGTPEPLYVVLEDSAGNSATIAHPDPAAVTIDTWEQWPIPVADFAGVDPTTIKMMAIGVGDPTSSLPKGSGVVYIDDIELHLPSEQ